MAGPIRIGPRYLGGRKAAEQNRTSLHVWKPLKRWGSYLLADAVGTGKSYIALSVALGLFRKRERRPFRLLILAGPVELGQSWFDKVAGRHGRSVGTLAAEAGEDSFLEMYWGKRRRPEFVTYQLRRRWDLEALEDKLSSEETSTDERKLFTPGGSGPHGRIEVLIATPKLIAHLSRRGIEGRWRRWVARADFIIADEVFSARNESTIYGHLLREGGEDLWPRGRPLILGLSATLLSRDLPDAESVIRMALDWGRLSGDRALLSDQLRGLLRGFRQTLRLGLRSDERTVARAYRSVVSRLEDLLQCVIVRTQPERARGYHFWTGGLGKPGSPKDPVRSFPVADVKKDVIQPLRAHAATSPDAADHLAWFLRRAPKNTTVSRPVSSKDYSSWTGVTESPTPLDGSAHRHPKLSSLREWVREYYKHAEQSWDGREEPKYKLLIYVHHVRTAGHLSPRPRSGFGRELLNDIKALVRGSCARLASRLPELFKGGKLHRPSEALKKLLAGMGWSMELLLRRNSTLLLSALLNASKHGKKPFAAISRTLRPSKRKAPPEPGILLLQRSTTIREKIFEREPRILSFDAKRRGKKSEKTLSSLLLDPAHLSPALQRKLVKVMRLERGEFQALTFKFRMAENRRRLEALARDARAVFDEDERWNSLVEKARLTPRKVHRKLTARTKLSGRFHRDPTPIAVLTGQDSDNRNFITQRFREPGNPLILVLTHVCQIGIDLHPFCWDILHYSPAWTPHEGEQKTGRIDRPRLPATKAQLAIGDPRKRHEIRVHHLLWPFTYDERILSRLNVRGHYAERLLGSKGHHDAPDDQARRLRDFRPLELESRS